MSVTVKGLTKNYGAQIAVNHISFEAQPGSVLGFLGPNGAGKSTTMRMLTGYLPPAEGELTICGFDMENQSLEAKKNIGYLPENNPLYPEMYVKEFLDFVADIHQIRNKKSRIEEVISITGLSSEQHKKITQLSKGYKQRVGLAQAILHDPQVLILDEPTSGLDPNQLIEIRSLIRELGKTKTVILSTHIMQEVEAICDRVIIINKGEIVADDLLSNLLVKHNEKTLEPIFIKLTKMAN
jgi:ABC-2 type transport system ATP-binding protein